MTNSGPSSSTEGSNLTFNLTVTNTGPTNTTNVVLTDTLDPNLKYVSATKSQGTVTQSGSIVTFSLGSLAVGQTVTATVTAQALEVGNLSDTASATSSLVRCQSVQQHGGRVGPRGRSGDRGLRAAHHHQQTLTNQTVATFTHANGVEPASAFVATINWGDATTSTGTITQVGQHLFGDRLAHLCGQRHVHDRDHGGRTGPRAASQHLDATGESQPVVAIARFALLSDGSVMIPRSASNGGSPRLTPDASAVTSTERGPPRPASRSRHAQGATMIVLPDGRLLVFGGLQQWRHPTQRRSNLRPGHEHLDEHGELPGKHLWQRSRRCCCPMAACWPVRSRTPTPTSTIRPPTPGPPARPNSTATAATHESWTLLPDGSILSYDVNGNPGEAQRLDPTTMTWVDAGSVPVSLEAGISAYQNMGPGVLLPDGRVLQLGRSSNTAIYTPPTPGDGTNGAGSWAAGPVIPDGLEAGGDDATPAARRRRCCPTDTCCLPRTCRIPAVRPGSLNSIPRRRWRLRSPTSRPRSPTTRSIRRTPPHGCCCCPPGRCSWEINPSGSSTWSGQLYVYTPSGSPQAAWQPTITSVVANGDGSYTLTGTQLNGLSAGASHGTSTEMATNYPIVELTDSAGHVFFARTSNWSSTGVATGSTPETTDFSLPPTMPYGTYSLTVVANGIASAPVSFTGGTAGPFADLVVTNSGPTTGTEGNSLTYSLTVTNNGPYSAPNVVLTDTLDPNLTYQSATKSQGSSTRSGNVVTFSFGSLGVGQTVTATVTAAASEDGNLNNSASVTSSISDPITSNNLVVVTTAVAEPPIVVSAPKTLSGKNQSNVTVATFTHANGVEPASAFVATINWGDGTTSTGTITESGTTYTVKGSHTYASNGSHTVTTTVVESESERWPAAGTGSSDWQPVDHADDERGERQQPGEQLDEPHRDERGPDGGAGRSTGGPGERVGRARQRARRRVARGPGARRLGSLDR